MTSHKIDFDNNMYLWNQIYKTDPDDTKAVKFGRNFTAVDAQKQIRNATKVFGPFGLNWGVKDKDYVRKTLS